MIGSSPQIKRPRVLGIVAAAAIAAGAAASLSAFNLSLAHEPAALDIRAGTDRLEATLEAAPPAMSDDLPIVWAVTAPDCVACAAFTESDLAELRENGFEVRVLELSAGNGPRRIALTSVVAENGAELELPALFWRRGNVWRASFGPDAAAPEHVRADFNPEA